MNVKHCHERGLVVHSDSILKSGSLLARLRATFLTPRRDFYIRPLEKIPQPDAATHEISICGRAGDAPGFTLADLQS
jgi:hypothetical protein